MTPATLRWPLILLMLWANVALADEPATRAPEPTWVTRMELPKPSESNGKDTQRLLEDRQVRVEAGSHTTYRHVAYALNTSAGVQSSSELSIGRASDARLSWHFVRLHRQGRVIELLPTLQIKVIQPEARLGAKLYDESRQEVVFLSDVRVGDVIEYAYSLRESDRVLGGAFAERYWLASNEPIARDHLTVSWPEQRTIHARAVGAKVEVTRNGIRYDAEDLPAYRVEEREPEWFEATPYLELSEFEDWASVVRWGVERYQQPPLDPTLLAQADKFRKAGDELAQATAAVRFVQDEVRYLGIEVAEQALVPQPPAQVLAQRYGDCKGKTNLLIALLRQLGFDAAPALVSTHWQRAIAEQLPAPYVFDHVITQVKVRGHQLWIDATESEQHRSLLTDADSPWGRALVLRAGESELRELHLTMPSVPQQTVREVFALTADNVTHLDVETIYTGSRAEETRSRLAHRGREEIQNDALNFYGDLFGKIQTRAPFEWQDELAQDRLIFREHYTLADVQADDELEVSAWSVRDYLLLPSTTREPRPFLLYHPAYVQHDVRIENSRAHPGDHGLTEKRSVDNEAFKYDYLLSVPRVGTLELTWTFQSKRDHVSVQAMPTYVADAKRAREVSGHSIEMGSPPVKPAPQAKPAAKNEEAVWAWVAFQVGTLGLVLGGYLWRRRRKAPTPKHMLARTKPIELGETAASAIRVKGSEQLARALASIECCRKRLFEGPADEPSKVRYGDEQLVVYKRRCPHCQRMNARYFANGE